MFFRNIGWRSLVWNSSRGFVFSGSLPWALSLGNFCLGNITLELPHVNFRFEAFARELSLSESGESAGRNWGNRVGDNGFTDLKKLNKDPPARPKYGILCNCQHNASLDKRSFQYTIKHMRSAFLLVRWPWSLDKPASQGRTYNHDKRMMLERVHSATPNIDFS